MVLMAQTKRIQSQDRVWQIDLIKTIAMVFIIVDHSFSSGTLLKNGSPFWERIAIPLFMIVMGFNAVKYFEKQDFTANAQANGPTLAKLYSKSYFISRIRRYVIPYVILFLLGGFIRLYVNIQNIETTVYGWSDSPNWIFIGYTPFYGPGIWFIPVLMQSILILPLCYYCFNRRPKLTVFGMFILEFLLQLFVYFANGAYSTNYIALQVIREGFLFRISGIGIGMWIARNPGLFKKKNMFILVLAIPSVLYLYANTFIPDFKVVLNIPWVNGDYNMFSYPWAALWVLIALTALPNNVSDRIKGIFKETGSSTYHILLFQMFYFSFWYHFRLSIYTIWDSQPWNYVWYFPLNLAVTFAFGILLYQWDCFFYKNVGSYRSFASLYKILLVLGITFFCVREIVQYWLFVKYPVVFP